MTNSKQDTEALASTTGLADRERWLDHRGHKILNHSYAGLSGYSALEAVQYLTQSLVDRNEPNLLFLVDITNAYANKEVLATFKNAAVTVKPFIKKTAVVGATGVLNFFLHLVNTFSNLNARPFDTVEEALDWLVS